MLQIRMSRSHPGGVRAGAPEPARGLETAEVEANLRWFTAVSPRGLPVDALVLSGLGVASRPDLAALVALARSLGVRHVTVHVGEEDLARLTPGVGVDRYVLPVRVVPGQDTAPLTTAFAAAHALAATVDANLSLSASSLVGLAEATTLAIAGGAASLTFTSPFPGGPEEPAPLGDTLAALRDVIPRAEAAGLGVTIKGLPACHLAELGGRVRKSTNRWYVDAEHQREGALLFFPGVLAFTKGDACRFCGADARCDGGLAAWLARPGVPPLRPLDA
jgi:hypothetical protein